MKIFAERFSELRKEKKISQAKAANGLGVSPAIVCYWETDRSEPTIVNLAKIAKYFGVSADFLIGLTDW